MKLIRLYTLKSALSALRTVARLLTIGVATVLFPFLMVYQPKFLISFIQRLFPDIILQVPNDCNQFGLTFDDGPKPPYTNKILDILREYGVKATFFVVGERLEKNPEVAQRIRSEGHEMANHFYNRTPTFMLSRDRFVRSLETTDKLIGHHRGTKYARPAFGLIYPWNIDIAKAHGYTLVLGSAYPGDGWRLPRWYILWSLKRMLRTGVIVVLHDGIEPADRAVAVLPDLLSYAAKLGLQAVPVSRLLESRNHPTKG